MSSEYTPADTLPATITIPSDGDNATADNFNAGTKDVADRTQAIQNGLEHIATAQSLTTSRDTTDGAKRIRQITSLANLGALVVGAGNDKEIAVVNDFNDMPVLYQYHHGDVTALLSPFIVDAASSTGRWFWLGAGLLGNSPGLPYADGDGRLQGAAIIPDTIVQVVELSNNGTAEDIAQETGVDQTDVTYQDPDAQSIFTLTNIETGDIIEVELGFHGRFDEATDEACRAIVALHIGQNGSFTKFGTAIFMPIIGGDSSTSNQFPILDDGTPDTHFAYSLEHRTIRGKYTAVSTDDVVIKPMLKTNGSGTIVFNVYSPIYGIARVIRP